MPCDQVEYKVIEELIKEPEPRLLGQHSAEGHALSVAPNPNRGFFEVSLPQKTGGLLTAYNVQGQKIKVLPVAAELSKVNFDLTQSPNGLYWLVLSNEMGKVLGVAKVSVVH